MLDMWRRGGRRIGWVENCGGRTSRGGKGVIIRNNDNSNDDNRKRTTNNELVHIYNIFIPFNYFIRGETWWRGRTRCSCYGGTKWRDSSRSKSGLNIGRASSRSKSGCLWGNIGRVGALVGDLLGLIVGELVGAAIEILFIMVKEIRVRSVVRREIYPIKHLI